MSCINSLDDYIMCKYMLNKNESAGNHFNNRPEKQLFPSEHTPDRVQWKGTINAEDLAYAGEILSRQIYLTSAGREILSPYGYARHGAPIGYNGQDSVPPPNGYHDNLVDTLINPLRGLWPSAYTLWGWMDDNEVLTSKISPWFRFSSFEFGDLSQYAPEVKISIHETWKLDAGDDYYGSGKAWYIPTTDKPTIERSPIKVITQTEAAERFLEGVHAGGSERVAKLLSDTTLAYAFSDSPLAVTTSTRRIKGLPTGKTLAFREDNKPIELEDLRALVGARSAFTHGGWINSLFFFTFAEGEVITSTRTDSTSKTDPSAVQCEGKGMICTTDTIGSDPINSTVKKKFTQARRVKSGEFTGMNPRAVGTWDRSRSADLKAVEALISTEPSEPGQQSDIEYALTQALNGTKLVEKEKYESESSFNHLCTCIPYDSEGNQKEAETTIQLTRHTHEFEYQHEIRATKLLMCATDSTYVALDEAEQQCASFTVGFLVTVIHHNMGDASFNISVHNCGTRHGEFSRENIDIKTTYELVNFTYDRSYKYLTEVDDRGNEWKRPCWVGFLPSDIFDHEADYGDSQVSFADAERQTEPLDCDPEPDGSERFRQISRSCSNRGKVTVYINAVDPVVSSSMPVRT